MVSILRICFLLYAAVYRASFSFYIFPLNAENARTDSRVLCCSCLYVFIKTFAKFLLTQNAHVDHLLPY